MNKLAIGLLIGLFSFSLAHDMSGMKTNQNSTPSKRVICPVEKQAFDKSKAVDSTVYKGKTYYFCCLGCKPKFLKNPEKYIKTK